MKTIRLYHPHTHEGIAYDPPPEGIALTVNDADAAVLEVWGLTTPPPTLADVGQLNADSDYTRFVAADVEPQVRNAAMKKLFSEPGFNVMDGLDVYIDDYGKPDPLPPSVLRRLVQSRMLGLFDDPPRDDADTPAGAADRGPTTPAALGNPGGDPASIATLAPPDEDPDLRLQPHDAAGCADGAAHRAGALQDAAGQR